MHSRLQCGNITVPGYATMVVLGILMVCMIAAIVADKRNLSHDSIAKIGISGGIFAVIGAKMYSLLLLEIEASFGMPVTKELLKSAGYSYLGALPFGLVGIKVCCYMFKINFSHYMKYLMFEIPLLHAFWKVGCYLGGCCYGIEYSGRLAVCFPEGSPAPVGIPLFPVQLLEVGIGILLAVFLYIYGTKKSHVVELYLFLYGAARIFAEQFRYRNEERTFVCNIVFSAFYIVAAIVLRISKKHVDIGGNPCE